MADLINVGTFPNDATGDPARLAFQKVNGLVTGLTPFSNITVGPPTNNSPPLTVSSAPGSSADSVIHVNYSAGAGYGMLVTGTVPGPGAVFGLQVQNLSPSPTATTFGLIVANDSTNTLVVVKTSSTTVGPVFPGTPAGELSYLQSGGGVPISLVVGAANALSLTNTQATFFNTPVTAGATVQVTNTSTVSGDISRVVLSADTTSVALFAAPAAQSVAIVTGGPTGAQSVLRNLGNYPVVFGTANTFRGQIAGNGAWTIVNAAAASNASIGAAGVQASWEFAANGNVVGTSSLSVGQTAAGVSQILARGAQILNIGTANVTNALQIASSGNIQVNIPASGDGIFLNGVNAGTNGLNMTSTGAAAYNAAQWANSAGTGFMGINGSGNISFGSTTNTPVTFFSNGGLRMTIQAAGGVQVAGAMSMNNNAPYAGSAGWGTPTGTGVIANFPGASAILTQCSQAIATILAILKNFGLVQA